MRGPGEETEISIAFSRVLKYTEAALSLFPFLGEKKRGDREVFG